MPEIKCNAERLQREIDTLATLSDAEAPAVTRVVFSERDREARAWLEDLYRGAGLEVRHDAVGNTFACWPGSAPELPAVASGSHIDAIPHSGRYDGVVGVLGALEAIRSLQASGFRPRRSIELIQFTSEEPTRFGMGCLGSRLMCGALGSAADALRDSEDTPLAELCVTAGFSGSLDSVRLPTGFYASFVELHIEQGPLLEREGVAIGVVTDIAAPATLRFVFHGEGGHAGGRLMPGRRDALCAASEAILAVERAVLATGAIDTVGTVGTCEVFPGAVNSIPSRVRITVDVRDIDGPRRDVVIEAINGAVAESVSRRGIRFEREVVNADPPANCAGEIVRAVESVALEKGLQHRRMVSRAYHDSLFMARLCPVGMIFIPCRGGVSHRPDEYSSPEDIASGVEVLAGTLARLAST